MAHYVLFFLRTDTVVKAVPPIRGSLDQTSIFRSGAQFTKAERPGLFWRICTPTALFAINRRSLHLPSPRFFINVHQQWDMAFRMEAG